MPGVRPVLCAVSPACSLDDAAGKALCAYHPQGQVAGAKGENGRSVPLQVRWGTFACSPTTKPVLGTRATLYPVWVHATDAVACAALTSLNPAKMTVSITGFVAEGQKMAGKLSKSAVLDAPGIPTLQATLNRVPEKDAVMARPLWALEAPDCS